ncbi:MAG: hypothetical protein VW268_07405 [Rhodospirillaceae bacterium]
MSDAVWLILYGLNDGRTEEYVDWFHGVHIPEKLARPGYTWASHYQSEDDNLVDGGPLCLALFGAETTAVFHDPSPAQLAPKQPPETKAMMRLRVNSGALIAAGEWSADASGRPGPYVPPIEDAAIRLTLCDAAGDDMAFNAWLVQEHLSALAPGGRLHKLAATTGNPRHVLIHAGAPGDVPDFPDRWTYPLGRATIAMRKISR